MSLIFHIGHAMCILIFLLGPTLPALGDHIEQRWCSQNTFLIQNRLRSHTDRYLKEIKSENHYFVEMIHNNYKPLQYMKFFGDF